MLKLCKNKNVHLIGEQTAAAQNDVTAKKLLADCPKTGLPAARAISSCHSQWFWRSYRPSDLVIFEKNLVIFRNAKI